MTEHPRIEIQFQGLFQRMDFAPFVAGFLQHAKGPIRPFHMIVGAIDPVPSQEDDHFFKALLGQFLQGFSQLRVGLVVEVVDHTGAARAGLLWGNPLLEESVKLSGETAQQGQLWSDLNQ